MTAIETGSRGRFLNSDNYKSTSVGTAVSIRVRPGRNVHAWGTRWIGSQLSRSIAISFLVSAGLLISIIASDSDTTAILLKYGIADTFTRGIVIVSAILFRLCRGIDYRRFCQTLSSYRIRVAATISGFDVAILIFGSRRRRTMSTVRVEHDRNMGVEIGIAEHLHRSNYFNFRFIGRHLEFR